MEGERRRRSNVNSRIDSGARIRRRLNQGLGRLLLNTDSERIAPKMRRISFGPLSILMYKIMTAEYSRLRALAGNDGLPLAMRKPLIYREILLCETTYESLDLIL